MAFEGDVGTFPLGDLLAWLAGRRASGVLTLTRGMTIRRFHLRDGQIRLVSSSDQEMLLGQLLIERKLLGPDALARTLAGRGRSRARLGRLLMREGLVTPDELNSILAEKVRRLLADALAWSEGRFLFEAPQPRPDRAKAELKARRGELDVAVDLRTTMDQIEAADACLDVDDSDVIETVAIDP
jgi:hypothetical protein